MHIVAGPGPDSPTATAKYYVKNTTLRGFASFIFKSKIAQYFGLVGGWVHKDVQGLRATKALFRGLLRDQIEPGHDEQMFAFVTNPPFDFALTNEGRLSGGNPHLIEKPKDSVFVTYILIDEDRSIEFHDELDEKLKDGVIGEICDWEWVLCSPDNPALPERWRSRYQEERWII